MFSSRRDLEQASERRSDCLAAYRLSVASKMFESDADFESRSFFNRPRQPNSTHRLPRHATARSRNASNCNGNLRAGATKHTGGHQLGRSATDRAIFPQNNAWNSQSRSLGLVAVSNESLRKPFRASGDIRERLGNP